VAQTVAAARIEAVAEPVFHPDSYGYRPRRGALDAVARCRERCWEQDWVIDLDVRKFFDSVPWDLVVKAVEAHVKEPWVILYVKRWLAAPVRMPDGTLAERDTGTPQGSSVSPVLANLFMHYAFDAWMAREFPGCPFERYADDAVVHCSSEGRARQVLAALEERMRQVGLELHPDKTRIVYCKDGKRRRPWDGPVSFDFLGYTFRARATQGKRGRFTGFSPAASDKAVKRMSETVASWHLNRHVNLTWEELAQWIGPVNPGLDELLRAVLPFAALPTARAHQLPRRRMASSQVPATTAPQGPAEGMGQGNHPAAPRPAALAMGNRSPQVRARRAR
jgi:RNA-directed DNA polymerase